MILIINVYYVLKIITFSVIKLQNLEEFQGLAMIKVILKMDIIQQIKQITILGLGKNYAIALKIVKNAIMIQNVKNAIIHFY